MPLHLSYIAMRYAKSVIAVFVDHKPASNGTLILVGRTPEWFYFLTNHHVLHPKKQATTWFLRWDDPESNERYASGDLPLVDIEEIDFDGAEADHMDYSLCRIRRAAISQPIGDGGFKAIRGFLEDAARPVRLSTSVLNCPPAKMTVLVVGYPNFGTPDLQQK